MSQRGKRQPNRTEDGPIATKRRKCRPSTAEEEVLPIAVDASGSWTPRAIPSIYNRATTEAPAELFRKDLISAMKLPDSEPLSTDEYWVITDQWKQEWERGVQVPVNPDSLPEPTVTVNHFAATEKAREFKLPKSKYIRITKDENFASDSHFLSSTPAKAEKACAYDLDDCDAAWLNILNGERACMGLPVVTDDQLERVVEELELRCWEKVQTIVKAEEGLGIEYDENVICDVCRSPDSEEGNEMVFCDCCNICVHQACYGITTIPSGSWLCRTCALGQRPECVLCPNKGGAMKCTRSGQKWAHVSCALWIPEVSIGCVERMEPITKISSIPQSRWALICVLCRERVGACIQCSVKTCKTAYHVTCAFKHGLEMRAIIEDENADDGVKLRSYCQKHSVTSKKEKCGSQSEEEESKRRKRKDMTSEEKNQARAAKLHEVQGEFEKHVSVKDITQTMDVDPEGIAYIYNYWKLKRRAGFNRPLLPPKSEDVDMLSHQQEQADIEKMKMFVQLRQDLERVRNLCYMVSRREKLSRSFFRMREQTFHKQAAVLSDPVAALKGKEVAAVVEANHGPSIYDRLYSQPSAEDHSKDFDVVVARIAGAASPLPADDKAKADLNGLVKCPTERQGDNPYKRLYFNGASRRRSSLYGSMSSESESDAARRSPGDKVRCPLYTESSSREDDVADKPRKSAAGGGKVKAVLRKKSRKIAAVRAKDGGSTSDDEDAKGSWAARSRSLRQMEREMASATDDSDELLPMKTAKEPQKIAAIYSDSDSDGSREDKYPPCLRTKAAMKEFSGLQAKAKVNPKTAKVKPKAARDDDDERTKDKENVKVKTSKVDLIVPQRQAAKKASESMRFSQGRAKDAAGVTEHDVKPESPADEPRAKIRHKSARDEDAPGEDAAKKRHKSARDDAETEEALAYVPQRQAAKKAADSIKSGMVAKVAPPEDVAEPPKAKDSKVKEVKEERRLPKSPAAKAKPPPKSRAAVSSSSSSSSSRDSSSSSESDARPPAPKAEKRDHAKELVGKKRPASIGSRPREAWPFLDKGDQSSRGSSSSSAASDSSDSDMFTRKKEAKNRHRKPAPAPAPAAAGGARSRKAPDKKLKTSEGRPDCGSEPPTADGLRRGGGKGDGDRLGDAARRPRAVSVPKSDDSSDAAARADRPRAARAAESPRGRAPTGDRRDKARDSAPDGPREQDARAQADEEVSLEFCAKGRARESPARPRDAAGAKLQRQIMRAKVDSMSAPKRMPKPSSTKLYDRRATKNDKPPMRKGSAPHNATPKTPEPRRKSPARDARKSVRGSDARDEQRRAEKGTPPKQESVIRSTNAVTPPANSHRVKEVKDLPRKSKESTEVEVQGRKAKDSKEVVEVQGRKSKDSKEVVEVQGRKSKDSKEVVEVQGRKPKDSKVGVEGAERSRRRPREATPPMRDRRVIPVAQVAAVKRDDSPDSVLLDPQDGTLRRKPKAMPKCKKKELEMMNAEKEDVVVVVIGDSPARIPTPKRAEFPDDEIVPKPELIVPPPAESFLPKLDLEHDFLVPEHDTEPRKITSRTSSLCGPPFAQRSIFSPQQPKDAAAADLFDFENDILAVDETVNDDGFNDGAELCRPLTFSFGSDFLFKEESKEDSERETLNLVEKLRLQYAQKSGPAEAATPPTAIEDDDKSVEMRDLRPEIAETKEDPIVERPFEDKYEQREDVAKTAYPREDYVPLDARAASIPSVEKLDRTNSAPSDERWVPPSADLAPPVAFEAPPPPYDAPPPPYEAVPSVAPPPSPFTDHRARAKWADSEVLPVRRSSSSSGSSSSSSSRRDDPEPLPKHDDFAPFPHNAAELYAIHGGYPQDPYHPYGGPVALFPPATAQLPFPSPGAGLYPPMFNAAYLAPPPAKEEPPPPLSAAFTSSSHNMAFIAAMVAAPGEPANLGAGPTNPMSPVSGLANQMSPMGAPSNQAYSMAAMTNQVLPMAPLANQMSPMGAPPNQTFPMTSLSSQVSPANVATNQTSPLGNHVAGKDSPSPRKPSDAGKKSPTKGTRTSARVTSQLKSPGKSPRQEAAKSPKVARSPRPRGKSRGGGARRGRGRGKAALLSQDVDRGTIHSKLAGTVYDLEFDDDAGVESMRAMRDRRRSADAPRFVSPAPSPREPEPEIGAVLPGPVDMRTYSAAYGEPTPANPAAYHNHVLGQFATAVAQQHVADFVEDLEKELHSALAARNEPPPAVAVDDFKASLNDSRNQLKVKIKGPFLDANYATSTAAAAPAPPPADAVVTPTATAFAASGVSSLRRMRKKELLRQYCSQDMNMADPSVPAVPAPNPPVSRTIITIPKAVASMTTIPTREDYKAVVDANMEKKRRKEKPAASAPRELRHLELADVAGNCVPERRRSLGSTGSNASSTPDASAKKRGRPGAKPGAAECPVLKIKLNSVGRTEAQAAEDRKRLKPPKKRLSSVAMPSMEDMKRESMKFRRMVMAEFDLKKEEKKLRREARAASGKPPKKRKHKDKDSKGSEHEVRIVANSNGEETSSAPKLIIRFNKRASVNDAVAPTPDEATPLPSRTASAAADKDEAAKPAPSSESEKKPATEAPPNGGKTTGPSPLLKVRASKVTPIRLKLARCSEGYVMKTQAAGEALADKATATVTITDAEPAHGKNGSPVIVSKGCEVR